MMNCENCLKGVRKLALSLIAVLVIAGTSSAMDVYMVAQEFTYQNSNPANPYYSPVLSGITMWGFAPADAAFNPTGPATVPGPTISVPAGDSTLVIHVANTLPVQGDRGSATTSTSIVISGQTPSLAPGTFPVWTDGTAGPRTNADQRVRSFTTETLSGSTSTYTWNNLKPGTFLYQSGTHPAVQVQMGLYGPLIVNPAVAGQAYNDPSTAFDNEVVLLFSEIDPELHFSVISGRYGTPPPPFPATPLRGQRTSAEDYHPKYFLVNGRPFAPSLSPIPAGNPNERLLLRFLNAGLREKTPTLLSPMTLIAEDGNLYTYSKEQYSLLLPAGKTMDAIVTPSTAGYISVLDRSLNLTNDAVSPGGDRVYLQVGASQYTLTVAKDGNGAGTIALQSLPGDIYCGAFCSEAYIGGTQIRLAGIPEPGSLLTNWSGGGCAGLGDCTFTLNADTTVTGTFTAFSAIQVLTPTKGEVLQAGSTFTIWWGAPAKAVTFRIKYSLNNGATWNNVENGNGVVDNSYLWTVPVPPKTKVNCRIKVVGFNAKGVVVGSSISKKFTISVP